MDASTARQSNPPPPPGEPAPVPLGRPATPAAARLARSFIHARRTLWALAGVWLLCYALERCLTPPAAGWPAARGEATDTSFVPLYDQLGTLPAFTFRPAGTGATRFGWIGPSELLTDGVRGTWDPQARPLIQAINNYYAQPAVHATLDRIVQFCEHYADADHGTGPQRRPPSLTRAQLYDPSGTFRHALTALTVRARYRFEANGDVPGALNDLRAALRLAAGPVSHDAKAWWHYDPMPPDSLPLLQAESLAVEGAVPAQLARSFIAFLQDEQSLSLRRTLLERTGLDCDPDALLDECYTDDGQGNGWFVVSVGVPALQDSGLSWFSGGADVFEYGRLWNMAAPLFNDRRTVRAKLLRLQSTVRELDALPLDQVSAALVSTGVVTEWGWDPLSVLDGTLAAHLPRLRPQYCQMLGNVVAHRRALVVMLALAAYRDEHGGYPAALDALVPSYLDELPRDLISQQPFVYRRQSREVYDLGLVPEARLPDRAWPDEPRLSPSPRSAAQYYSAARPPPQYEE